MAWTFWDLKKIENYTGLIVAGKMTIEQVPEKYRAEVQKRVDTWFTSEALAAQQTTETI